MDRNETHGFAQFTFNLSTPALNCISILNLVHLNVNIAMYLYCSMKNEICQ